MRVQVALLIAVLFLLAGCSRPDSYWYYADRTLEDVKADYCACRDQAKQEAAKAVAEKYFDHLRSPTAPSGSDNPPRSHSGGSSDAEASWGELYKQNAFEGCMRGRGYVRLNAYRVPEYLRTEDLPMGAIAGR